MSILQFVSIETGHLLNLIGAAYSQWQVTALKARDLGEILSLNYKNYKYCWLPAWLPYASA